MVEELSWKVEPDNRERYKCKNLFKLGLYCISLIHRFNELFFTEQEYLLKCSYENCPMRCRLP